MTNMDFKPDDRVRIKHKKYTNVPVGATGTIRNRYSFSYAIVIDGIDNPRSEYNCFYFTERQIEPLYETNKEEPTMEGNYRIALVKFLEGTNTDKTYEYACYDYTIEENDCCVVMSAHHGIGVGQVVKLMPKDDRKITREIICKADFTEYQIRCDKRKAKAELEKKMKQRAAELQELSLYKMLAEHDTEMKDLLKEYEDVEAL